MPLFDFKCRKCSDVFETLVRGNEVPACPKCGSEDLERQVSAFNGRVGESAESRVAYAARNAGRRIQEG